MRTAFCRPWLNFTLFVSFPVHPFSQSGVNFRPEVRRPCHYHESYTINCYKRKDTRTGDEGAGERVWVRWIDRKWAFPVLINVEQKWCHRVLKTPWRRDGKNGAMCYRTGQPHSAACSVAQSLGKFVAMRQWHHMRNPVFFILTYLYNSSSLLLPWTSSRMNYTRYHIISFILLFF